MKKILILMAAMLSAFAMSSRSLIVYYSYTSNVHRIACELQARTGVDTVRIQPAEKGLRYEADNYALGSALISAIRDNPDDASSYPAIDPVNVDLSRYDTIFIGAPLWWSDMAAPLQTYLFHNGAAMGGKKIGLFVSSASSGIGGVEADARRLVPGGDFLSPSLWVRSAQSSSCGPMLDAWLTQIGFGRETAKMEIAVNGHRLTASLADNSSAQALLQLLKEGPVTVNASEYGGFEMVGALPQSLPTNDEQTSTVPGDIILYQGRSICFYYGNNSWNFTRLGKIDNVASLDLRSIFGVSAGNATFVLSVAGGGVKDVGTGDGFTVTSVFTTDGRRVSPGLEGLASGFYIARGRYADGTMATRKIVVRK